MSPSGGQYQVVHVKPLIVVDQHIPFATELFSEIGRVRAVAGHEIDHSAVVDADAIVVRSITRVDKTLLSGSNVRFVGTATAGTDHLDTGFLSASGILWASAPGANASSVVEYVLAAISVIASRARANWRSRTLGVVGCGHVGELLAETAERLGMSVLRNDPPRAECEGEKGFIALNDLMSHSDIVSVHLPLERHGPYPTFHLLEESKLSLLKRESWLIQSSRGGTCDESALIRAKRDGRLEALVLDVFENEPRPSLDTIAEADIATGHIAGYSIDAKRRGVEMIRSSLCSVLGIEEGKELQAQMSNSSKTANLGTLKIVEPMDEKGQVMSPSDPGWLDAVLRQMIDIRQDDERFRSAMGAKTSQDVAGTSPVESAAAFHDYRASYPPRRTFSAFGYPRESSNEDLYRALGLHPVD